MNLLYVMLVLLSLFAIYSAHNAYVGCKLNVYRTLKLNAPFGPANVYIMAYRAEDVNDSSREWKTMHCKYHDVYGEIRTYEASILATKLERNEIRQTIIGDSPVFDIYFS